MCKECKTKHDHILKHGVGHIIEEYDKAYQDVVSGRTSGKLSKNR